MTIHAASLLVLGLGLGYASEAIAQCPTNLPDTCKCLI